MDQQKNIHILIADDFKALRDVIRLYLAREPDLLVVGEAPELDYALESAKQLQPDVIILNDYLPPVDSALAAALFREHGISAPCISISMELEPDLIRRSLQHGITGYLHKDEINPHLVTAIRSVCRGDRFLSPKTQEVYNSLSE